MSSKKKKKRPSPRHRIDTASLFQTAVGNYNNGKFAETKKNLQKLIKADPTHADACNLLGIVQCQESFYSDAILSFRKAMKINPGNPQFYNNLGIALSDSGNQEEAIMNYEKAIAVNPDYPDALYNLGIAYNQTGLPKKAAACYRQVILKNPGYIKAYNNLGSALLNMGQPEEAVRYFNKAISLHPEFPEVYNNLGNAYHILNQPEESIKNYKKVIEFNSSTSEVYSNLGSTLSDIGNNDEACLWFLKGIETDPLNISCWQGLADTLSLSGPVVSQESLPEMLTQCLVQKGISKQNMSGTVMGFLKQKYTITDMNQERIKTGEIFDSISTPLFNNFLKTLFITDPDIEQMLTAIRRLMLDLTVREEISEESCIKGIDFVCALANQCFLNDYVFFQTETEAEQVIKLHQELLSSDLFNSPRSVFKTILFATYHPLNRIFNNNIDSGIMTSNQSVAHVIRQQILEHLEEEKLKSEFNSLCEIQNATSLSVRTQYEENPYPRWLDIPNIVPLRFGLRMKKIADTLPQEVFKIPAAPEILIAGCGTGLQALNAAAHFPDSIVTAIDLSRTSLAYAARKAKELENKNIRFLQGDILELESLNRRFDIIECAGVLHHMKEPVRGWEILKSILKPGGFMLIGLYSEIARRNIVAAREFISQRGFTSDPPGIRNCRNELFNQPEGSLLRSVTYSKDFYTLSTCRDLLFHVQEHRFTIPEISKILDDINLEFIGFEFGKQAGAVSTHFKTRYPEKGSAAQLDLWQKYEEENPHSFSKMYQFWVRKK